MAEEDEFHDDNPPPPPPPVTPTQQAPHTLSTIKLPILKKGEYDIWAMKMEHYLGHTDYLIWEVIQNGNGPVQLSNPDLVAMMNLRRCRNTFSSRFQSLLSQLEIHGAGVSTKDANQKFLRVFESVFKALYIILSTLIGRLFLSKSNNSTNDVVDEFDLEEDQEEPKALVTLDGDGVDWTGHEEDEQENFALMAHSNSGSNNEVTSCSKECEESYAKLKKLYDKQREQLGVASIEIQAYTQALKKMSTRDKSGLGYGNQIHEGVLSYEKEALESVFDSRSSDVEDSPVNDRFAKVKGMHVVPPLMTRIYMPFKSDFGIDESNFTYGPKLSKTSESDAKTSDFDSCKTNSSVETLRSVPELVVVKPKVVSQPKVWSDAPIIEEYESDSDDEYMIKTLQNNNKTLVLLL
ncbi:hypothetical protein Tco_0644381 [Tanacetum coccineum]